MNLRKRAVIVGCFVLSAGLAYLRGQGPESSAYVLGWNDGELLADAQGRTTSITVSPETGGTDLSFWTTEIPAGSDIIVHRHDRTEEILFVHRGAGTLLVDDEEWPVEEGDTIYVPRGTYHGLRNDSESEIVMAFVATPPDLVQFIRGMSWPIGSPRQITDDEIQELSERYDSIARPN